MVFTPFMTSLTPGIDSSAKSLPDSWHEDGGRQGIRSATHKYQPGKLEAKPTPTGDNEVRVASGLVSHLTVLTV
jgi:hypothetical protein